MDEIKLARAKLEKEFREYVRRAVNVMEPVVGTGKKICICADAGSCDACIEAAEECAARLSGRSTNVTDKIREYQHNAQVQGFWDGGAFPSGAKKTYKAF